MFVKRFSYVFFLLESNVRLRLTVFSVHKKTLKKRNFALWPFGGTAKL